MSSATPEIPNSEPVNSENSPESSNSITEEKVPPETIKPIAHEVLNSLLRMLGFQTEIDSEIIGANLRIRIKCEDAGRLIGRGGSNLSSLQFLLNRLIFRRVPGAPRVYLDVEGFKEEIDGDVIKR